jgi:hypothetical protein
MDESGSRANDSPRGLYRWRQLVIIDRSEVKLPEACLVCGSRETVRPANYKVIYQRGLSRGGMHSAAQAALQMYDRQIETMEFPACPHCVGWTKRLGKVLTWIGVGAFLVVAATIAIGVLLNLKPASSAMNVSGVIAVGGIVIGIFGTAFGVYLWVNDPEWQAAFMDSRHVWLVGIKENVLRTLPQWPGPTLFEVQQNG